ncbi:hypothetical protein [Williamsia sterculiae]|uniref:Uncharacterized protein n=1 Tax=Williamsia sterculiae TaxID=1344003 RepID=A0A1N7DM15_9NOCA|nr:hypothetical protein [Williamsia sterculiae]SIR76870.1 hypothetical protein SAMN05445060_0753 [Williamsia sterculiae]
MQVIFRRIALDRHVTEIRLGGPAERRVELSTVVVGGPVDDDLEQLLPGDMLQLIVEMNWSLGDGVYGAVAFGRDPRTERPLDRAFRSHTAPTSRSGRTVRHVGGRDLARSLQLVDIIDTRWRQRHAGHLPVLYSDDVLEAGGATENEIQTCLRAADLAAARWREAGVGGTVSYHWPALIA